MESQEGGNTSCFFIYGIEQIDMYRKGLWTEIKVKRPFLLSTVLNTRTFTKLELP
jgi:hypothetical protein